MKIAVVGTGVIGKRHLQAIRKSDHFSLSAVCDINEQAAKTCAEEFGVPYCTDYREIPQKTDAQAVVLNLPHWLHCEVAEFFLDHGIHVLVEKPMANTEEECNKMIQAAVRNNRKLAIGHVQRFFSVNEQVRKTVESGEMGDLCMITEFRTIDYFRDDRPRWFLDKRLAGGGILMNYGAHALDKIFYVTGCRAVEIAASVGNFKNEHTIEGHGQIFIKLENKVSAAITFSGYGNSGYETIYYFTRGALKVSNGNTLYRNVVGNWELVSDSLTEEPLFEQLEEFYRLIENLPSTITTGEYGRDVVSVLERAYIVN